MVAQTRLVVTICTHYLSCSFVFVLTCVGTGCVRPIPCGESPSYRMSTKQDSYTPENWTPCATLACSAMKTDK